MYEDWYDVSHYHIVVEQDNVFIIMKIHTSAVNLILTAFLVVKMYLIFFKVMLNKVKDAGKGRT